MVLILSHSHFRKPHKSSIFWGFLIFLSNDFPYILLRIHIWALWWPLHKSFSSSSRKRNKVLAFWQGPLYCINIGVSTVPLHKWGKIMLTKKFFINTGISITVKTNNGSYYHRKNHSHTITLPPTKLHSFLKALSNRYQVTLFELLVWLNSRLDHWETLLSTMPMGPLKRKTSGSQNPFWHTA